MSKESVLKLEGVVIEVLPNTKFKVKLVESEHIVLAYLGGKMRQFDINIQAGDKVDLECSPYDLSKGRIVYRK